MFFCSHNCTGSTPLSMKFPCRLCSVELTDQQMLKDHFTLYHPENLQFECRTCHQEFDDLSQIVAHMGTHLKTANQCSLCLHTSLSKKDLHNHYLTVHPGVDRSTCLICNKKYSDPGALSKHTMVHTGERPYYCPFCFTTFGLKCSQVVHIRRHTNYRPYKCQYCPKSFFNSGEIGKHLRLHTGEKPYKCTICKTSFTMRETLTNHLKTHNKIKKCQHCPMGFDNQKLLEAHMSTHSGVKPFQCPLCKETNFHFGSLQRHITSVHIDNLETNCKICGQFEEDVCSLAQHILTHRTDYVGSRTQFFDYVKNATKSHSSSKINSTMQRNKTSRDAKKKPRKYSDTFYYVAKDESHQPGMVEEFKPKCKNFATCDTDVSGKETKPGSRTKTLEKKRVRRKDRKVKKITTSQKKNKEEINHAVDNSVSNAEEYEDNFEIPPTISSDTSNCEDSNSHNSIKTKIKDEDADEDQNEGIQEVEVPVFGFLPLKNGLECSICQEYFMSQDELLQHVGLHII